MELLNICNLPISFFLVASHNCWSLIMCWLGWGTCGYLWNIGTRSCRAHRLNQFVESYLSFGDQFQPHTGCLLSALAFTCYESITCHVSMLSLDWSFSVWLFSSMKECDSGLAAFWKLLVISWYNLCQSDWSCHITHQIAMLHVHIDKVWSKQSK